MSPPSVPVPNDRLFNNLCIIFWNPKGQDTDKKTPLPIPPLPKDTGSLDVDDTKKEYVLFLEENLFLKVY